jgi:hypothetical protein
MAIQYSVDTIALHSEELRETLLQVKIPAGVDKNLSSELRHIAWCMSVGIPLLMVHGIEEARFFNIPVLEIPIFDENAMVIEWCNHMNRTTVFPKLPV